MKKTLILLLGFAIFITALFWIFDDAKAYTIEETLSGALPFTTWADGYTANCNNEFWAGQGLVCDAYGYVPDHNFDLTAVRLYNVQCDSGQRTTKSFKAQIRLNSTGAVLAETEAGTIDCVGSPPVGTDNTPVFDLAISGTPLSLSTLTTYAFSIAVIANPTDNLWARTANASVMGASLMSGEAPPVIASIGFLTPTSSYSGRDFNNWIFGIEDASYSQSYKIDVNYSTPDYSILYDWTDTHTFSPSASGDFPVGFVKSHTLYAPLLGTSSTIWRVTAELSQYEEDGNGNWGYEVIDTTSQNVINISGYVATSTFANNLPPGINPHTGFGENGIDPNSTSSVFYVDCEGYTIGLFSSTTLPGIGCIIKKTSFSILGWLFVPPQWASDMLADIMDFSDIFPFSLVREVVDITNDVAIINAVATSSYSNSAITLPQIGLATGNLLSSSTLKDTLENPLCNSTCAENLKENIFNAERMVIWGGAAILVITLIF